MTGGLMKSTSHYALAAAAGLFIGTLAITPAKAADLGGDCCADLEERVAELEATTVRKGNRVVSVQLYGQVNKAILFWDDGVDSDAYIVDNDYSGTRLGVRGSGSMAPGWTSGYRIEFQFRDAEISGVSQDDDDTDDGITFRLFNAYVESEQFGRVTLGQADTATNGITEINLGGAPVDSSWASNSSFVVRGAGDLTWSSVVSNLDGNSRNDVIRYDTPTLFGFIASVSWGDDDIFDAALRFSQEWNSIRFAAGVGYSYNGSGDTSSETISGSASIMHTPSGIYLSGAYGKQERDNFAQESTTCGADDQVLLSGTAADGSRLCARAAGPIDLFDEVVGAVTTSNIVSPDDPEYFYLQGGITRNWTGLGATTIYGEYAYYEDFGQGTVTGGPTYDGAGDLDVAYTQLGNNDVTKYGFGINQDFDSAATQVYVLAEWYELDAHAIEFDSAGDVSAVNDLDAEDWFSVVTGMRVRF